MRARSILPLALLAIVLAVPVWGQETAEDLVRQTIGVLPGGLQQAAR